MPAVASVCNIVEVMSRTMTVSDPLHVKRHSVAAAIRHCRCRNPVLCVAFATNGSHEDQLMLSMESATRSATSRSAMIVVSTKSAVVSKRRVAEAPMSMKNGAEPVTAVPIHFLRCLPESSGPLENAVGRPTLKILLVKSIIN